MIKYKKPDLLALLRLFNQADENTSLRDIDQVKSYDVDDQSTLVSFRMNKFVFFLLTDHRAFDDKEYIEAVISNYAAKVGGLLLDNPTALGSYAMPYKGKEVYIFKQSPEKIRLDKTLASRYPELSRSTIQKYIKNGHVYVNDELVVVPKKEVSSTDRIALEKPVALDHSKKVLPILYIDDDVIVIDKPAGILTHSKGVLNDEFTVADFFSRYTTVNRDSNRPGIVHRLDRDTSGVMIGARNDDTAEFLKKQFSDRSAEKTYDAIVVGVPKNQSATIDVPIGRNPSHPSTFLADAKGKPAITHYEVVGTNKTMSHVVLQPKTGRTHQLRVHMAYIGHPILGDRVYGTELDRLYLHARELRIFIPSKKEKSIFISTLPAEFKKRMT